MSVAEIAASSADRFRSALGPYDQAVIAASIEQIEAVADTIARRYEDAGTLIDVAARLQTVLIHDRNRP